MSELTKAVQNIAQKANISKDAAAKNLSSKATSIIKKSTMSFINQIASKNSKIIPASISANFIEYINSIIFVYDNASLNDEVFNRIKNDTNEIILEFNRNNYNFVIESINKIIKNIISEV